MYIWLLALSQHRLSSFYLIHLRFRFRFRVAWRGTGTGPPHASHERVPGGALFQDAIIQILASIGRRCHAVQCFAPLSTVTDP
jgi:hypothetical protein